VVIMAKPETGSRRKTYHHDHDPSVHRYFGPYRESINEGNDIEKHESSQWGLVEEQLHAVHLELLVVTGNPDRV
jgi:hypothetical protein